MLIMQTILFQAFPAPTLNFPEFPDMDFEFLLFQTLFSRFYWVCTSTDYQTVCTELILWCYHKNNSIIKYCSLNAVYTILTFGKSKIEHTLLIWYWLKGFTMNELFQKKSTPPWWMATFFIPPTIWISKV